MGSGYMINPNILKKVHYDKKKNTPEEKNVLTAVGKSEVTGKTKTPLVRHHFPS